MATVDIKGLRHQDYANELSHTIPTYKS